MPATARCRRPISCRPFAAWAAEGSSTTGGDLALQLAGLYDVSSQTLSAVRDFAGAGTWDYYRAATTLALVLQSPEFYVN